jgi:hypothetical protein
VGPGQPDMHRRAGGVTPGTRQASNLKVWMRPQPMSVPPVLQNRRNSITSLAEVENLPWLGTWSKIPFMRAVVNRLGLLL